MALTENRKERMREYGRAYREANKERVRENRRAYYHSNKERAREAHRAWEDANKDRLRAYRQAYYQANNGRFREAVGAWQAANKERARAHSSINTARRRGAEIDPFLESELGIQALIDLQRSATECRYCRSPLEVSSYHLDHITPISRGGKHELSNLAITCATCNLIKHNRTEGEYREYMATEMLERVKRVSGAA